jgi:hypothetical protein
VKDMAAGEIDKPPVQRRRRPLWLILGGLLFVIVAGLLLIRWHWRHEFQQRIEAIRAGGSPVTLEELDKWYAWPESGENAAAMVLSAASCYVPLADKTAEETLLSTLRGRGIRRTDPLDEDLRAALMEHITANAQARGFLHDAAAIEGSRYPVDLKKGYAHSLLYLSEVMSKANVLPCLEALLHAETGDPRRASEAVMASLAVTRSLAQEPTLIWQINRLTCQREALVALQRILSRMEGFTDDELLALSRAAGGTPVAESWTRGLIGERCFLIGLYEQPGLTEGPLPNSPVRRIIVNTYKRYELGNRSDIIFLDLMDRLMQVRQLPPQERMSAAKAVEAARNALPKRDFIIHEWMPSAVDIVRLELTETARLATASCGLAVERYRLARGALPGTLRDLVPTYLADVPADPFDGKPLRYKRLERGYVVYSVGPDGNDDGGKELPSATRGKRNTSPYDITFIIER